ncbi:MAG TPA: DNA repair protein RecO [Firmicutes bacterium]|nr:DNA repair protein RecO [Bacillota bacterium]
MVTKTAGIVLKQRNIGDLDRILTILTKDSGLIEANIKGIRSVRNNPLSAVSLFGYYDFSLYCSKYRNIVNSADVLESFFALRMDVEKFALAGYFGELLCALEPGGEKAAELLRLILNTLYLLEKGKRSPVFLKSVFELRAVSVAGFMPDFVGCRHCGAYEGNGMYFFPQKGYILCENCITPGDGTIRYALSPALLSAIRHILYSELEKLFQFQLSGISLDQLSVLTEYYTLLHTERSFNSLELYKRLLCELYPTNLEDQKNKDENFT